MQSDHSWEGGHLEGQLGCWHGLDSPRSSCKLEYLLSWAHRGLSLPSVQQSCWAAQGLQEGLKENPTVQVPVKPLLVLSC